MIEEIDEIDLNNSDTDHDRATVNNVYRVRKLRAPVHTEVASSPSSFTPFRTKTNLLSRQPLASGPLLDCCPAACV
jgi:hypothetical protein